MNRRGFLARLIAAPVVAMAVLRAPIFERPIAFVPDATEGFSIRYIQNFEVDAGSVTRFDCLYGFATLNPEMAVRLYSDPLPWYSLRRWIA